MSEWLNELSNIKNNKSHLLVSEIGGYGFMVKRITKKNVFIKPTKGKTAIIPIEKLDDYCEEKGFCFIKID